MNPTEPTVSTTVREDLAATLELLEIANGALCDSRDALNGRRNPGEACERSCEPYIRELLGMIRTEALIARDHAFALRAELDAKDGIPRAANAGCDSRDPARY